MRIRAEVGAYQYGVAVLPRQLRLRFRQLESVGDELPLVHVEFAHDGGVGAAA